MWLLLSGEGKNDIGRCEPAVPECDGDQFEIGTMTVIIDKLINSLQGYELSYIECKLIHFISEQALSRLSKKIDPKRRIKLAGKKRKKETIYYEKNARALAQQSQRLAAEKQDKVIAILFRDADGTQSSNRGEWQEKWDSMQRGFELESFSYGVPMLPKPKSEAWLLCALRKSYDQHCNNIENASGNDKSKNSLKIQLDRSLNELGKTTDDIKALIEDGIIDLNKIDIPSFKVFKQRLQEVIKFNESVKT